MTSRSRPTCESCRLVHPAGSQCPFRPQRSIQQSFNGVRTVSNDQPICRNFNAGRCSLGMCKYAHVCMSVPSAVGASNSTVIVNISPCTSSSTDFTSACTACHTPLSLFLASNYCSVATLTVHWLRMLLTLSALTGKSPPTGPKMAIFENAYSGQN